MIEEKYYIIVILMTFISLLMMLILFYYVYDSFLYLFKNELSIYIFWEHYLVVPWNKKSK